MTRAELAYKEYRRIQLEMKPNVPKWPELTHHDRLSWQAAVAAIVMPEDMQPRSSAKPSAILKGFFHGDDPELLQGRLG